MTTFTILGWVAFGIPIVLIAVVVMVVVMAEPEK
jgi:hypothetical protein